MFRRPDRNGLTSLSGFQLTSESGFGVQTLRDCRSIVQVAVRAPPTFSVPIVA